MANRPTFTSKYEEKESDIKDRMLGRVSDEWRKEPGDFIHDAVAPSPLEVKQLQVSQDEVLKQSFAQYAEGEYLDLKAGEVGLTREAATPNKRTLNVTADAGVNIPAGHIISSVVLDGNSNPLEYTVDAAVNFAANGTQAVAITCKTNGVIGNLATGSSFILLPPLPGISTIVDQGTDTLGKDTETDQALYDRYDFKIKNPDTGGNKNDYVRWAKEVAGVGSAKTIPIWNGNGTVKVVITDTADQAASAAVVTAAQTYLDPGIAGLGDGKAPCGAAVTAISATALTIDIVASVTYDAGYDPAVVKADYETQVTDYLKTLVFTGNSVSYNQLSALLTFTKGVSSFTGLTVNAGTIDIAVGAEQVAVKGTVTI